MSQIYYPTIGLEVHAELATATKMFCHCKNDADEERPNVNTCPVCMAHPGTLPVPNKTAIESVIKVGLAIGADIANFSEFDRKNYFYPDIPKGYQISQYKYPIVSGGELAGVKITRIHLEEDTANSKHDRGDFSLVDFNRAGVPLMELVTEPVIHDADTAMKFAKELQLLLRTLGVAHANMDKGEMRVELNISISPDPNNYGTKVEIKNLNSFSVVGKAAAFEIARMSKLYDEGRADEIVQETRGWDDIKQATYSQRKKENSHDYRYFPDPDIPKFYLHDMFNLEDLKKNLPELPWQKRERLMSYGIKSDDADILTTDQGLADMFEATLSCFDHPYDPKHAIAIANFTLSDIQSIRKKDPESPFPRAVDFAILIRHFVDGTISSRVAKDLIPRLIYDRIDVDQVLNAEGLLQKNDEGALRAMVQKTIDANPSVVAEYKSGKEALLMFFVGQIMKETKGSANPALIQKLLKELLA